MRKRGVRSTIDALNGSYELKRTGYNGLVDCVLHNNNSTVEIDITKIVLDEKLIVKNSNEELDRPYFLRDNEFNLEHILFEFDGIKFAGAYERLK